MTKRLTVFVIACILLLIGNHIGTGEPNKKQKKIATLQFPHKFSPEPIRAKDTAIRRSRKGSYLYILDSFRGVFVKKPGQDEFSQLTHSSGADAIAVDSRGQVYLADTEKHRVTVLSEFGMETKSLTIPYPRSVAVLSDGNLVVGSTFGNKLIHIYSPDGKRLRSFGDLKTFDADNRAQNHYLNRGKAVVDSEDNIYYVPQTALIPFIKKFSKDGTMLREFPVEGESVDLQTDFGRKIAENLPDDTVGGATIINSAFVDPETGHLWICLNGSSKTGAVYEYDSDGKKLDEYAFHQEVGALSGVEVVFVAAPYIYVFANGEALVYDLRKASRGDIILTETFDCPPDKGWPECKTNCSTLSPADDKDCTAALKSVVQGGVVISRSCNDNPNGCELNIDYCKDNIITHHSVNIGCDSSGGGGGGGGTGGPGNGVNPCDEYDRYLCEIGGGSMTNWCECVLLNAIPPKRQRDKK